MLKKINKTNCFLKMFKNFRPVAYKGSYIDYLMSTL